MKRIGIAGLCIAAVVATGVVSATAVAFSPPEIGRCVKVAEKTGKFTSNTCIKLASTKLPGSYEWEPGAVKTGLKTTGGIGTLETLNGTTVTCKTEASGGNFASPKTVTGVFVTFTGCKSAGITCNTMGAKEGEIITNELEGRIGIENKLKKKVAFDLFPVPADEGLYVTFNCGVSLHIKVGGSVLVNIPSDKMLTSLILKYHAEKGHQKPEHFEGEPNDVLMTTINTKEPEQSGITINSTQTTEESLEVNAVF
jgi:hypothetical protein